MIDITAVLIFLVFWLGGMAHMANAVLYKSAFLRWSFVSFGIAMFTGASFYFWIAATVYKGGPVDVNTGVLWSRAAFGMIALIVLINALSWLVMKYPEKDTHE